MYSDKERLKQLEEAIIKGATKFGELHKLAPEKFKTQRLKYTCPFCCAVILGTDVPKYCPHCGTKFKEDDDLQIKKSWMDKGLPRKRVSRKIRN